MRVSFRRVKFAKEKESKVREKDIRAYGASCHIPTTIMLHFFREVIFFEEIIENFSFLLNFDSEIIYS